MQSYEWQNLTNRKRKTRIRRICRKLRAWDQNSDRRVIFDFWQHKKLCAEKRNRQTLSPYRTDALLCAKRKYRKRLFCKKTELRRSHTQRHFKVPPWSDRSQSHNRNSCDWPDRLHRWEMADFHTVTDHTKFDQILWQTRK